MPELLVVRTVLRSVVLTLPSWLLLLSHDTLLETKLLLESKILRYKQLPLDPLGAASPCRPPIVKVIVLPGVTVVAEPEKDVISTLL